MAENLIKNKVILKILEEYQILWSLSHLSALAHWDINTYMPQDGMEGRAKALSQVAMLRQKIFLDKKFVSLIKLSQNQKNLNPYEKAIVRILKRSLKHYQKLPPEFIEEYIKVTSAAHQAWKQAKEKNKFSIFEPYLKKIVDLSIKRANYLGFKDNPYDGLLDDYEEDLTSKQVQQYFDSIKQPIIDLIKYIKASKKYNPQSPLEKQKYDIKKMDELNKSILKKIHYNQNHIRLDISPHPFSINIGPGDQRITTRYEGSDFARAYSSTIHEYGHALYELQSPPQLDYTPINGGSSLIIHESQSRFWENIIGRSREFIEFFYEDIKNISPEMKKYSVDDIYTYLNLVKPSLIRTEADEVTYHLHVLIRFEIERDLINGKIKVKDLPKIWNQKYKDYLGISSKTDSQGVLQDIHWSQGSIGYFPTYSFGTALSVIIKNSIEKDLGPIPNLIKSKDGIIKIQNWLKENIHRYGSTYTFPELLKKLKLKQFSSKPLIEYLEKKYKKIY